MQCGNKLGDSCIHSKLPYIYVKFNESGVGGLVSVRLVDSQSIARRFKYLFATHVHAAERKDVLRHLGRDEETTHAERAVGADRGWCRSQEESPLVTPHTRTGRQHPRVALASLAPGGHGDTAGRRGFRRRSKVSRTLS